MQGANVKVMQRLTDNMKDLAAVIEKFRGKRIAVVGDVMLDRFIYGKVSRISPEAPVPVVEVQSEVCYPGGAANVARNIRSLGGEALLIGRVGKDAAAMQLKEILRGEGLDDSGLVGCESSITNVKTRVIARTQQVVRVDRELRKRLDGAVYHEVVGKIHEALKDCDALIVEDYGKGVVTQDLVGVIGKSCAQHGKIWTVDPNSNNPLRWEGATAVKPNRNEAFSALGRPVSEQRTELSKAAAELLTHWGTGMVLLTLGEDGMLLARSGREDYWSACTAREVYDVSGAGDTSIATFTLALASGATAEQATDLANAAAGIVVGKLGTAAVEASELAMVLTEKSTSSQ